MKIVFVGADATKTLFAAHAGGHLGRRVREQACGSTFYRPISPESPANRRSSSVRMGRPHPGHLSQVGMRWE